MKKNVIIQTCESRLSIYRDYFGKNGTVFDSLFAVSGNLRTNYFIATKCRNKSCRKNSGLKIDGLSRGHVVHKVYKSFRMQGASFLETAKQFIIRI